MQPENLPPPAPPPAPPPQKPGSNPYSFIYNNPNKTKKSIIPTGNSIKQRIFIVAMAMLVLLIIGIVVMTFIGKAGKKNVVSLTDAIYKQAEIIRITELASIKSNDSATKNLAMTTNLSLASSQSTLLGILKTNGIELTEKQFALKTNEYTTTLLTNAAQSNTLAKVFLDELTAQLNDYKAALLNAHDSAKDEKSKKALSEAYTQAEILTIIPKN